ncbi:MAG: DNA polymerase/3'-5' exonuclease PolX [Phycisphaeraceae bacterium]
MAQIDPDLVRIFEQTSALIELTGGNRFRANAYDRAARAVDRHATDLSEMDDADIQKIDGIGEGMAKRIAQYKKDGRIDEHQELLDEVPEGLLALLEVPGLGPKGAAHLWQEAGVENKADLRKKAESGELQKLKGFGKKKVENLLASLDFAEEAHKRARIGRALPLAQWVVDKMRKVDHVERAAYAGSLRRGRETVGDIDVLVAVEGDHGQAVSNRFTELEIVGEVLSQGKSRTSIRTTQDTGRIQIDLRVIAPDRFGAAQLYFTGSKAHNVRLRERALKRDMTLNEYGLFELKNRKKAKESDEEQEAGELVAAETEERVYEKLGLAWIPPELREDRNEIKLAEKGDLPELLSRKDIKAELHTHTRASDGHWSIEELAAAAADRGFHTLAITDHSKSQVQANGLDDKRLEQHIDDVREVAEKMKKDIAILAGSEVDILSDGKLDYPDSLLKKLDFVVASPHAALSQDPKKATDRIRKAIDNRYVTIIGHATGRMINRREGLSPDLSKLFEQAKQRGIAFEINANSYRLDLRDDHARLAIEHGVALSINTDAHGPADLDQLIYGVLTARRAGAEKKHVINCWTQKQLADWIALTRP